MGADDLAFALSLADDADAITLARFRAADLHVDTKPDLTPVSEADRAVEAALRERIARERPGEPVLGEEEGGDDAAAGSSTRSTAPGTTRAGSPIWATLIAFADRVAVVSAPHSAGAGGPSAAPVRSRTASRIQRLRASTGSRTRRSSTPSTGPCPARAWDAWHLRGFGDFWAHMLVAEGAAELAVDARRARDLGHGAAGRSSSRRPAGAHESSVSWNGAARRQRAALTAAS